jgi:hypothetical protein
MTCWHLPLRPMAGRTPGTNSGRHDYTVDILGSATRANYTTNYKDFQGIKMPTTRRIYAYDEAMQKVPEPLLVAIDFGELTFS